MNKYYLQKTIEVLSLPLFFSRLHYLTKPIYSGIGSILMFHRVLPKSDQLRIHNHKSLEISPEQLENIIQYFNKKKYRAISLDELVVDHSSISKNEKFVIYTFDDGYIDNYTYAYPIFKKHGIPFTIYVATNMPDGNALLWWYLLEELIVKNSKIILNSVSGPLTYNTRTTKEKEIVFNEIRKLFASANKPQLDLLVKSLEINDVSRVNSLTRELALTWEQLIELSRDPLVTIGAHTVNHFPLNTLSYKESEFEILKSKEIIESHGLPPVKHFCYPLGYYGDKEIKILQKSQYKSATTIKMANTFAENLEYPFSLPRIMINSLTDQKILEMQVSGLLPALRNRFRRVVV
jgi:peptidoglycan/xylan/chitin deacetylase (PgdA/CDA1 family)